MTREIPEAWLSIKDEILGKGLWPRASAISET